MEYEEDRPSAGADDFGVAELWSGVARVLERDAGGEDGTLDEDLEMVGFWIAFGVLALEAGAVDLARDVAGLEVVLMLVKLPLEEFGVCLDTVQLVGRLPALVSINLSKVLLVSLIAVDFVLLHFVFVDR